MSSCSDYNDLGCFDQCDTVHIGVDAEETGEFTVQYDYLGARHTFTFSGTNTEELIIPAESFNESAGVLFRIKDPSGDFITKNSLECFYAQFLP